MFQEKLIKNGIKNLNEFGYPNVTKENIFTDIVYSQLFEDMLKSNKGLNKDVDESINVLLSKINTNKK